jgi:hypothetical protein
MRTLSRAENKHSSRKHDPKLDRQDDRDVALQMMRCHGSIGCAWRLHALIWIKFGSADEQIFMQSGVPLCIFATISLGGTRKRSTTTFSQLAVAGHLLTRSSRRRRVATQY